MKTIAIVPAGGSGSRMGKEIPKQYLELKGRPILLWTLQALAASPDIEALCLVTDPTYRDELLMGHSFESLKIRWTVPGGRERQDSVTNGFQAIPPCEIVLVHDGVRPFVTSQEIHAVIEKAREVGGAILAHPAQETMKQAGARQEVVRTIDRRTLWGAQTPQVFRYSLLKVALEKAKSENFLGTDEAMLVERLGQQVSLGRGSRFNIKITTPDDLILAERILDAYRDRH